jgi:hypothetical protein
MKSTASMARVVASTWASLIMIGASDVCAQSLRGAVAEQLSLAPVAGAVVVLVQEGGDGTWSPVVSGETDSAGLFALSAPGDGVYRVVAEFEGLSSPLSEPVSLTGTDASAEVALLLPSLLLRLVMLCLAEGDGSDRGAVVGIVRDAETLVALPAARVVASWQAAESTGRLEATSDDGGRYVLCLPASAGTVSISSNTFGRIHELGIIEMTGTSALVRDLEVPLSQSGMVVARVETSEHASGLVDLTGQVIDRYTREPVPLAVVRLAGTGLEVVSDPGGRFSFKELGAGPHTLEVQGLGLAVTATDIDLPPGASVTVSLLATPEAIEIEGLEVRVRSVGEQEVRASPFRRNALHGAAMAVEERRGARAFETLRRSAPGIRVSQWWREGSPPVLCISTNRRVQSLRRRDSDPFSDAPACDNPQVVVDGIRIHDGPEFLMRTPASELESIEFVTPVQAQILYGIGGDSANGVVVVFTRGRGPFVSPERSR